MPRYFATLLVDHHNEITLFHDSKHKRQLVFWELCQHKYWYQDIRKRAFGIYRHIRYPKRSIWNISNVRRAVSPAGAASCREARQTKKKQDLANMGKRNQGRAATRVLHCPPLKKTSYCCASTRSFTLTMQTAPIVLGTMSAAGEAV